MKLPILLTVAATLLGVRLPRDDEYVWPPKGSKWETDPEVALAKARAQGKGVFVYIATEACPHCKVMAHEVWPKAAVIEASADTICLAVYRWRYAETSPPSASRPVAQDSEWATRLDVKGYPQIRLLDGWGRTLASSTAHEMDRTAERVVVAMAAANSEGRSAKRPDGPTFPPKLMARLPDAERAAATDAIGAVRCRVWLRALAGGEWATGELVALFRADEDPVLRLRVLERLAAQSLDEPAVDAIAESVTGQNDYVRCAAVKLLGKTGGKRAVRVLRDTIAKAMGGATGWKNPNNVLCDVVEASIATPDVELVEVLGSVLARHGANNYATVLATRSLIAIGRKAGADLVRPNLERAARLEGGQAAQIRREVTSFLDGK